MHIPQSHQARLALNTIMTELERDPLFKDLEDLTQAKAACFVSLHLDKGGQESLRGCIGTLKPVKDSLYEEIISNAKSAAFRDPRFQPLQIQELKDLIVTVDVLEEPEEIDSVSLLDPQIYGVIVESRYRRGVLLPNLPGVDSVEYQLKIARQKAGIGPNEKVNLQRFRVTRFY
jgi:AmmeMemoRadiSam system protein A